ncbi:hypothetical protein [Hansschlegelia plantiphila]|nr:hypothetical protein [Hansschlegelia plantiphila]
MSGLLQFLRSFGEAGGGELALSAGAGEAGRRMIAAEMVGRLKAESVGP